MPTPALFTRMSRAPYALSILAATASTSRPIRHVESIGLMRCAPHRSVHSDNCSFGRRFVDVGAQDGGSSGGEGVCGGAADAASRAGDQRCRPFEGDRGSLHVGMRGPVNT